MSDVRWFPRGDGTSVAYLHWGAADGRIRVTRRTRLADRRDVDEVAIDLAADERRPEIDAALYRVKPSVRECEWVELRKVVRRAFVDARRREWSDVLSERERAWAAEQFAAATAGKPCCDNFRVARMDSPSQMRRLRRQRARGCCGSREWVATRRFVRYLLGFNYGH